MKIETTELLMSRAIDGVATEDEREQLARALRADPVLAQEFEELKVAHVATVSLFQRLELPKDFSKRVMRRVQETNVPADNIAPLKLPSKRPLKARRATVAKVQRRKLRIYGAIAAISAAAAVMLAVGVFSGFFVSNGIGTNNYTNPDSMAEGRRGVPDKSVHNRTGTDTPLPGSSEDGDTLEGEDNSKPEDDGAERVVEQPKDNGPRGTIVEEPTPEVPDDNKDVTPEPDEPKPESGEVVEQPDPEPIQPKDDGGTVVEEPETPSNEKPEDEPGNTVVIEREKIGQLSIVSGRAEVEGPDGKWTRLGELTEIREGSRIRTSASGVALMRLDTGVVTLGEGSQILLSSADTVELEEGDAAIDRNENHAGHGLALDCTNEGELYTVYVISGCVSIERERRQLTVKKAVGLAEVTHEGLGSVLMYESNGQVAEIEFGEEFGMPEQERVRLADWAGDARGVSVMLAIDPAIGERPEREANWLRRKLPGKVEDMMMNAVTVESSVDLLTTALENEMLTGYDIAELVDEMETALRDVEEHQPHAIADFALEAANVAEGFSDWREKFELLMFPRPELPPAKNKPDCPAEGEAECPNDKDKVKRVDKPKKKRIVKKVPQEEESNDGKKEDAEADKPTS